MISGAEPAKAPEISSEGLASGLTEAIELARHKQALAEDMEAILKALGAISSIQGERREPTVFLSMKTGRSHLLYVQTAGCGVFWWAA